MRRHYVARVCGHRTKLRGRIAAYGERMKLTLHLDAAGGVDYCLPCLEAMAIPCAKGCGHAIFPGDPIALYLVLTDVDWIPEGAVLLPGKPPEMVCCLRGECPPTIADMSGYWMPGDDGCGKPVRNSPYYLQREVRAGLVPLGSGAVSQARLTKSL